MSLTRKVRSSSPRNRYNKTVRGKKVAGPPIKVTYQLLVCINPGKTVTYRESTSLSIVTRMVTDAFPTMDHALITTKWNGKAVRVDKVVGKKCLPDQKKPRL